MKRTQIYLTDKQKEELAILSRISGKKQSELIRDAIELLIAQSNQRKQGHILDQAAGIWASREDLPDFESLRDEWDR